MKWLPPLVFLLLSVGFACSDNPPKPDQLIKEDKYIDVMVELQLVRSHGEINSLDTLTVDSLTNEVFQKYEITDSIFVQSHSYYQRFPQKQQMRIEKAIERLKMDQVSDTTKKDSLAR
ncbi:DUF4296 domain-containing protein [Fodinibius sp. SL11]|uniref:DUF4296 domain-containing protein n=1 Tax=Fodinibius sp. SL11 TaxID=3425690 RepID=UPI003F8827AD